jgi:hypothetical protein
MINSNIEEEVSIAKDLDVYAFATTGLTFGYNAFKDLTPVRYMSELRENNIQYIDHLKKNFDQKHEEYIKTGIVEQIVRNNYKSMSSIEMIDTADNKNYKVYGKEGSRALVMPMETRRTIAMNPITGETYVYADYIKLKVKKDNRTEMILMKLTGLSYENETVTYSELQRLGIADKNFKMIEMSYAHIVNRKPYQSFHNDIIKESLIDIQKVQNTVNLEAALKNERLNAAFSASQKPNIKFDNTTYSEYTNYSGGATGGDAIWETTGKEYGLGKQINYRPEDLKRLTKEQMQEVENAYQQAVKDLGRRSFESNTFVGGLVRRDYLQAKKADAIFAISDIILPNEKGKPVKGIRYSNKMSKAIVDGGTGYAVQMGINLNKPVYVFHQGTNSDNITEIGWYKWNNDRFDKINTPQLTKNFAGIGTREINEIGKQAIKDVYEFSQKSVIKTDLPSIDPANVSSVENNIDFKIPLSNTLQQFLEVFFNINDENIIEPFAKKLTNEDKELLSKAIGRNYKDISQFDWYESIFTDEQMKEVFYYLKTGIQLNKIVREELLKSKIHKEYQDFVKENKSFINNFKNLPKETQKELNKDFDKLKVKNDWFMQEFDSFEYNKRKELLKIENYTEGNIHLKNSFTDDLTNTGLTNDDINNIPDCPK